MEENIYEPVMNRLWDWKAKAAGMVREAGDMTRVNLGTWSVKELKEKVKDFRAREKNIFELQSSIWKHLVSLSGADKQHGMMDTEALSVIEELSFLAQEVQTWVLEPMVEVLEAVQNRQMELLEKFANEDERLTLELEEAEGLLKKAREKRRDERRIERRIGVYGGACAGDGEE
ncbi:hypothetical protein IIZ77_01470 [Candidatus Saccharibacteria bacterium]|nr:hypothetical protein [Candidatus Saccharibacteria bacterium]